MGYQYDRVQPMRRLLITFLLLAIGSASAGAQWWQPVESVQPGVRVRVWLPDTHLQEHGPWHRQLLRATVGDVGSDTIRLNVRGTSGALAVARADIRRLDVSRGTSRGLSALERAAGFAVVGAISTALRNNPGGTRWPSYRRDWRAAEEGAKWGAVFGAVIGFSLPTERWHRVRLR
jgi:hypothetical protein